MNNNFTNFRTQLTEKLEFTMPHRHVIPINHSIVIVGLALTFISVLVFHLFRLGKMDNTESVTQTIENIPC